MQVKGMIVAGSIALALGACATPTPYQALEPDEGGYSEERLSEKQYRVVFRGNARTSPEQVERFLLRRAAELTLENGYDWFRATNRLVGGRGYTIQTSRGPVRISRGPGYSGWDDYSRFYTRSGLGLLKPIWRRISPPSGEAVEASAEVVFGKGSPPQVEGVIDARRLLQGTAQ